MSADRRRIWVTIVPLARDPMVVEATHILSGAATEVNHRTSTKKPRQLLRQRRIVAVMLRGQTQPIPPRSNSLCHDVRGPYARDKILQGDYFPAVTTIRLGRPTFTITPHARRAILKLHRRSSSFRPELNGIVLGVVAGTAESSVGSCTSTNEIVSVLSKQVVVAGLAEERIIAGAAIGCVVAAA